MPGADLSQLSDEQLQVYRDLLQQKQDPRTKGGVPGVQAPIPAGLQKDDKPPVDDALSRSERGFQDGTLPGPMMVVNGAKQLWNSIPAFTNNWKRGTSDALEGVAKVASPLMIPAAVAAPEATLAGMGAGYLGSKAGRGLVRLFGGGEDAQKLGDDIGGVAGGAAGAWGVPRLTNMIPRFSRAGENFETVMKSAGNTPINVTQPQTHALRIQQMASRGSTQPKVIGDFIDRLKGPNAQPMTYAEGRDFAGNASRLSADEQGRLVPSVRREITAFSKAMNEANGGAAQQAGVGDLYDSAMREYSNAARLRTAGKAVGKAAIAAAGGAAAYKVGKEARILP